jgi:ATP-binding cassette, subfamily B, bacterial
MRETARQVALLAGTALRVSPLRCLSALLEPAGMVIATLGMAAVATLVDGVVAHEWTAVAVSAAFVAAAYPVNMLLAMIGISARVALMEHIGFAFDRQIAEIIAGIPSVEHHERSDVADQLQILRQSRGALGGALNMIIQMLNASIRTAVLLVVMGVIEPRLLTVAVLAIPAMVGGRLRFRWRKEAEEASASSGRLAKHLTGLATDPQAGMELRVFGLRDEVRSRLWAANRGWRVPLAKAEFKCTLSTLAEDGLFALGLTALLGWLLYEAVHGRAGIGTVVLAAYGAITIQEQVMGAARLMGSLSDSLRAAARLLWLRDTAARISHRYAGVLAPPDALRSGIRLEKVGFRYPGSAEWALRDMTLDLPAGSVVALVGENGAGKSTLVKLLLGMYQPTEGRILIDTTDMADLDIEAWRTHTAGAFQDYARFEFLARETVGVGALGRLDDPAAVTAALTAAGGSDLTESLPHGLDTQLGASWDDGVDLSGGQWQKLALGRALMRTEPLLQVFDEPTANLDAPTEHALFERYTATARSSSAHGAITVLVTHRFSTVRAADLIVVVAGGRVSEVGPHADLVHAGGHYAELYELQARDYR